MKKVFKLITLLILCSTSAFAEYRYVDREYVVHGRYGPEVLREVVRVEVPTYREVYREPACEVREVYVERNSGASTGEIAVAVIGTAAAIAIGREIYKHNKRDRYSNHRPYYGHVYR